MSRFLLDGIVKAPAGSDLFLGYHGHLPPTRWGCWLLGVPEEPRLATRGEPHADVTVLAWNRRGASRNVRKNGQRHDRDQNTEDVERSGYGAWTSQVGTYVAPSGTDARACCGMDRQ